MAKSPLILATACNESYFQGLCVTLISAIQSTSVDIPIRIYVMDTGLTEKNHADLRRLIKNLRSDYEIIFQQVSGDKFKGMNTDYGGGYSTYTRLLIASMVPEPKAIYLDADFLVLRDLSELWSEPITPN
jgi:lipopolysaccharide biosynthesis glycosyltransferase